MHHYHASTCRTSSSLRSHSTTRRSEAVSTSMTVILMPRLARRETAFSKPRTTTTRIFYAVTVPTRSRTGHPESGWSLDSALRNLFSTHKNTCLIKKVTTNSIRWQSRMFFLPCVCQKLGCCLVGGLHVVCVDIQVMRGPEARPQTTEVPESEEGREQGRRCPLGRPG